MSFAKKHFDMLVRKMAMAGRDADYELRRATRCMRENELAHDPLNRAAINRPWPHLFLFGCDHFELTRSVSAIGPTSNSTSAALTRSRQSLDKFSSTTTV